MTKYKRKVFTFEPEEMHNGMSGALLNELNDWEIKMINTVEYDNFVGERNYRVIVVLEKENENV